MIKSLPWIAIRRILNAVHDPFQAMDAEMVKAAVANTLTGAAMHPEERVAQGLLYQLLQHTDLPATEKKLRQSIVKESGK